jgi:hypothetical protein
MPTYPRAGSSTRKPRRDGFGTRLRLYWRQQRRVRIGARSFAVKGLLRDAGYRPYLGEIKSYWSAHYGRPVHPLWHVACARVTGVKDVRYISNHEWFEEILPFFNDLSLRAAFRDKNLSDIFLNGAHTPRTVIKRMHGRYYAGDNTPMTLTDVEQRLAGDEQEFIIKPSQTDDGCGIRSLIISRSHTFLGDQPCGLDDIEAQYGANFIIQEKINQHALMAQVHPDSVNTIRMVTFRWKNEIRVLLAFARFGRDGKLTDNAGTGGLCCGIDRKGRLNDAAVDGAGTLYSRHPTTGYAFASRSSIPNYDSICKLALNLHRHIFHFDIVSWDFAIGDQGDPVFLEVNFQGVVHVYQFACRKPLFGDLTKHVLEAVRDNRQRRGC